MPLWKVKVTCQRLTEFGVWEWMRDFFHTEARDLSEAAKRVERYYPKDKYRKVKAVAAKQVDMYPCLGPRRR